MRTSDRSVCAQKCGSLRFKGLSKLSQSKLPLWIVGYRGYLIFSLATVSISCPVACGLGHLACFKTCRSVRSHSTWLPSTTYWSDAVLMNNSTNLINSESKCNRDINNSSLLWQATAITFYIWEQQQRQQQWCSSSGRAPDYCWLRSPWRGLCPKPAVSGWETKKRAQWNNGCDTICWCLVLLCIAYWCCTNGYVYLVNLSKAVH